MKQFVADRHTTPGTPELDPVNVPKVPVYDTLADVTADLANLSVGQIVATKDTGDELSHPVNVVEEGNLHAVTSNAVASACTKYPDYARGSLYTTQASSFTMPEDGYVNYVYFGNSDVQLTINDVVVSVRDAMGSPTSYIIIFSGYVKKGDILKRNVGGNIPPITLKVFGLIGA